MNPSLDEIREQLKDTLKDIDLSTVTDETRLTEDLHMDSLQMMMVAIVLESNYKLDIDAIAKAKTIGEVRAAVKK